VAEDAIEGRLGAWSRGLAITRWSRLTQLV